MLSNLLGKIKSGLTKTREVLVVRLRSMLAGRVLNDQLISELESALLQADVGVEGTKRLIDSIRTDYLAGKLRSGDDVLAHLKREIKAMWPEEDRRLRVAAAGPTVILVTGINGAGKTTSIAKLCSLLRKQNKKVLLAACDTFRAGAVRQLEIWGERLGVEVIKGQQGGDPAAVAFDACKAAQSRGVDYLIIDTAGRLHTQDPLMRQLAKIRSVVARQFPALPETAAGAAPGPATGGGPHETLLVLDATSGQNALRQAEEFVKSAEVTGIFLTKLDGTAKGGIVVAIRSVTSIPVKFVGLGETPDDVEPFDPDRFVEGLFAEEDRG
jgi:fused signal recognition particle receptor